MILTPVSPGEILDKITILEIKAVQITDKEKHINVKHELSILQSTWDQYVTATSQLSELKKQLKMVNQDLWNIEDNIRIKESKKQFDQEFIQIARSVYVENDKRAYLKKQINLLLGSELIEEKSYENYQ